MQNKKYKLGLSLSGGGAKGFAHLGIIQFLYEKNIYPNIISGTSAGALAGVLVADGHSPYEVSLMFTNKGFGEFGEFGIPHGGFFKSSRFDSFLKKNLKARTFEELKTPLRVIATNIEHGKMTEFSEGELIPTIVASCSVPIIFSPRKIGTHHYVDGGLFKNFPVSNIREECDYIIGINVSPIRSAEYKDSLKYVAERTFHYMSSANTLVDCELCDILMESKDFSKFSMFDLDNVQEIFNNGYQFAKTFFENDPSKFEYLQNAFEETS